MEVYIFKLINGHYYISDNNLEYLQIIPDFRAYDLMKKVKCIEFEKKDDQDKLTSKIKFENIIIKKQDIVKKENKKNIEKVTAIKTVVFNENHNKLYQIDLSGENAIQYLYFYYSFSSKEFEQIDEVIWQMVTMKPKLKNESLKIEYFTKILDSYYNIDVGNDTIYYEYFIFEYNKKIQEMSGNIFKIPEINQKVAIYGNKLKQGEFINVLYNYIKNTWSIIDEHTYNMLYLFGEDLSASGTNEA
jgi:hypothetical protein